MISMPLIKLNPTRRPITLRQWLLGTIVVLSTALCVTFFFTRHSSQKSVTTAAASLTVTSSIAEETKWPKTLEASGPIMAWQEAIIGSEISGQRLIEVLANVGDTVKKGQILARFNTDMLQAQKDELQANWVQAEADRKRAITLQRTGAMSTQLIESYINKAAVAKARLDAKNLELRYANIVAPDDGVISARSATLGAVSNPGSELFRMILKNQFEWRGELTAEQVANITPGQTVKLSLPDGTTATATIRQISPSFNPQTRMATVYADIAPESHAHAGMYANGTIEMGLGEVVSVPAESVVIRDGYSYVFTLPENSATAKVKQKRVVAGRHLGNQVEIISGLKAGEQIAMKGAGFLNDDDTVTLIHETENKA